ncbi:hypothetical protein BDF20DRAFT_969645 [Mycotypha africana]|uniref:uncharacterized protein n=1 Tax=Mycotypha africana TaxID=64632 RepID=UPI0022FFDCD4|nr:uncharacterized protein BDF20DRAFT_969645 [Mycotypha africana]KAI8987770.1 hypothetical protein BDF20DRAFT_969645 [Mycotypha africana]
MPEIAEVERARLRIHRQCINHKITHVEVADDTIVYKDIKPDEFAKSVLNKTLVDTKRYGKYFILMLDDGEGPHIVAHFGMTGAIRFKHEESEWPPRFYKLLITFTDPKTNENVHFGFRDPRRLARLRLVKAMDPLQLPPLNKLGFDPVLSLPKFEHFRQLVVKRAVPLKALLLDQAFSAGVGNWVADEVLYQSRIHPAQYSNTLTDDELQRLYANLRYVCETAVRLEANEEKFPKDWLMKHRWHKGKKNQLEGCLPNGTILQFETIGGRTTAFAPALQKLRVTETTTTTTSTTTTVTTKKTVKKRKKGLVKNESEAEDAGSDKEIPVKKTAIKKAIKRVKKEAMIKTEPNRKRNIQPNQERVVIVGCSSGIGRECALQYAKRGAKLVLFARRKELLESLKKECLNLGSSNVEIVVGDVTLQTDLTRLATVSRETFHSNNSVEQTGGVDTVIYCAGMISVRPFLEACGHKLITDNKGNATTIEKHKDDDTSFTNNDMSIALQKITTVNYFAAIEVARLFIPLLKGDSVAPNFLIVSSMAGKVGAPTRALYAGSKHALHGFFDSLRIEVAPLNIHIGLICPATVETDLRLSAVDMNMGGSGSEIAGSNKNKLRPEQVAKCIIKASDLREREVYIPALFGYSALWAKLLASRLVDYFAMKKYKV